VVHRERSYACIHPETYKYFFEVHEVRRVWAVLEASYGSIIVTPGFGIMEIQAERFLFRATRGGNPITVIRRRRCTEADVLELHERIGYHESP
jgi:lauroyl/myristoyl acyltransferase